MNEYIIYRRGYNTANNPSLGGGPETVPVARVQAEDKEEACRLASQRVTCYNNQSLFARLASEVEAEEDAIEDAVELL